MFSKKIEILNSLVVFVNTYNTLKQLPTVPTMPLSIPSAMPQNTINILATCEKFQNSRGQSTLSISDELTTVPDIQKVLRSMGLSRSITVFSSKGLVVLAFPSPAVREEFYTLFAPYRAAIVVQSDGYRRFEVFGTRAQAIGCIQKNGGVLSECAFNSHMTITFPEDIADEFTALLVPNGQSFDVGDSGLTTAKWQNRANEDALKALKDKRAAEEEARKAKAIQDAKDRAIAIMNSDAQRCRDRRKEEEDRRRGNSGGASATLTTASQKSVVMPSDSKTFSLVPAGHSWADDEDSTSLPTLVPKTPKVVQQPLVASYDDALKANIAAKERLATLEKDLAEKAGALAEETRAISVKIAQMTQKLSRTPENS